MALVLTVEAVFVILTFRTIFDVMTTIYEIDEKVPDKELKINTDRLNKAYELIQDREVPSLISTRSAALLEAPAPTQAPEETPTVEPNQ